MAGVHGGTCAKVEWVATLDVNKGLLCSTLVKMHADNRASLGDCSASDVAKTDGLVESSGLTGGVGSRSISDSVAQTKSLSQAFKIISNIERLCFGKIFCKTATCFQPRRVFIYSRAHFPYPCRFVGSLGMFRARRNDPMCQAIL